MENYIGLMSSHRLVWDTYILIVCLQGQLPVRWMAKEAIFDGQYTHASDV